MRPADPEPRVAQREVPLEGQLEGLTAAEARERLEREGYNELPRARRRSSLRIGLEVLREPMFALLLAAAVVYALIGEPAESLVLLLFATVSVLIAGIQRGRSERALEALRDLASPRALVIRDGQRVRIAGREVVRGDLVVLTEGVRLPADGMLVSGDHLEVDESLLTGESLPVQKSPTPRLPAPECSRLFGGSLVVRGNGYAITTATGAASAIGAIGRSLATITTEQPALERETRRLVLAFGVAALLLSTLAVLLYGFTRNDWLAALLGGIALGMALLPEEFPLVLTVFTVMGAWRLSRSRVLTRRASVIETLGATTVLCTDKTGTLTRNLMSVARLDAGSETWDPREPPQRVADSPALRRLLESGALASDEHPVDPMERALHELRERVVTPGSSRERVREYPLRPELLVMARVWREPQGLWVYAKGAPEAVARLCNLAPGEASALQAREKALGEQGMRVLAVAQARVTDDSLPESVSGFGFEHLGLLAFADPLRESVPEAVAQCRAAGIRVVMITGDAPSTARAIAAQAGLAEGAVITGAELESLDEAALAGRVRDATVFARITPAQKLRIVSAFKAHGEVVAMTGDGVNDAPALKAAHIGIAMGGRGTDVAREAASIVLLDDDFSAIVRGIRIGRRIHDNLRKAMGYICAIHLPIAGLALLPVLWGWPLLLTPMLIAMLELVIDPACSVVLEAQPEEADAMSRPPRARDSPLLPRALLLWCLVQGMVALAAVAGLCLWAAQAGLSTPDLRTLVFLTLVGVNLALIFVNRTFSAALSSAFASANPLLWWGLGITALVLGVAMGLPAVRGFFGLALLDGALLALSAALSLVVLLILQLLKRLWSARLAA